MSRRTAIRTFYDKLFERFGPQAWWPGETQVEIVVGAILTQNTNWKNVEYAIENLRGAHLLSWAALDEIDAELLAQHIRPAGYYNIKAKRLKNFVRWLNHHHEGELSSLESMPIADARRQLLGVNGVGPETADSILLYALKRPVFVIDAYTGRVARRHRLADDSANYDDLQRLFQTSLPPDASVFNEYHALLVRLAKVHCRVRANCAGCPLAFHDHDEHLR